jgi:hypothetical protein
MIRIMRFRGWVLAGLVLICGAACANKPAPFRGDDSFAAGPDAEFLSRVNRVLLAASAAGQFKSLGPHVKIRPLPPDADVPAGYTAYRILWPASGLPDPMIYASGRNEFAVVSTVFGLRSTELGPKREDEYLWPSAWFANIEAAIARRYGVVYTVRTFQNGVLMRALGAPTVELLFDSSSIMPSMMRGRGALRLKVLAFPPGSAVWRQVDTCEWLAETPPPDWPRRRLEGCERGWVQVSPSI